MARRRTTVGVLSLWTVGVLLLVVAIAPDRTDANFFTYIDESGETLSDDYVIDPQNRRKKVDQVEYEASLDRLIASALNETVPVGNDTVTADQASSTAGQSVACIGDRKPLAIRPMENLTVRKCCPKGQSFHRLSITTCHPIDLYEHMNRFSLLARELKYYGENCHEYGKYLRYNITIDKKCVGQRLIFHDRGTQMTLVQNGSLLVTRTDREEFYDDFCVEETGNSLLAAHICDPPEAGADLFSGWLGTVIVVLALLASIVTVLAYVFDRALPHRYGPLIGSHAGFLALAILVELLLGGIHQDQLRPIVEVLVEISYALFLLFSAMLFFSSATGTTSINYRLLLVVVSFIASCLLIEMVLTFYSESVLFLTVLVSLGITLTISAANIYTSFGRNHLGFNSSENPFEMINEGSTAKRIDQRRELTIVSTFACATQIIVWIPYSLNKYSLLSVLAWNAIIVFVVFVVLRRRSIGLCHVGQRMKVPAAGSPYAAGEQPVPRDTQTVLPAGYADEDPDGENELRAV